MKCFLLPLIAVLLVYLTAVTSLVAPTPFVMKKRPHHFRQYKVTRHDDESFGEKNKEEKLVGSGWWSHGGGKKPSVREEPEDNEPGDVPESRLHPRPILKRKYKIYDECYHPVSNQRIQHGSFSYHKESCLLCMCPFGRIKCEYTC